MKQKILLILYFCISFLSACRPSEPIQKPIESLSLPSESLTAPQDQKEKTPSIPITIHIPPSTQPFSEKFPEKAELPKPLAKNPWPPEGPYCRQFVDCCDEAQKVRGKISMLCLSIASRDPHDCEKGIQEVVSLLKSWKVQIPKYCE